MSSVSPTGSIGGTSAPTSRTFQETDGRNANSKQLLERGALTRGIIEHFNQRLKERGCPPLALTPDQRQRELDDSVEIWGPCLFGYNTDGSGGREAEAKLIGHLLGERAHLLQERGMRVDGGCVVDLSGGTADTAKGLLNPQLQGLISPDHIIVVEPNDTFREGGRMALRQLGYEGVQFKNLQAAQAAVALKDMGAVTSYTGNDGQGIEKVSDRFALVQHAHAVTQDLGFFTMDTRDLARRPNGPLVPSTPSGAPGKSILYPGTSLTWPGPTPSSPRVPRATIELWHATNKITIFHVEAFKPSGQKVSLNPINFAPIPLVGENSIPHMGFMAGFTRCFAFPDYDLNAKQEIFWHEGQLPGQGVHFPVCEVVNFAFLKETDKEHPMRLRSLQAGHSNDGNVVTLDNQDGFTDARDLQRDPRFAHLFVPSKK